MGPKFDETNFWETSQTSAAPAKHGSGSEPATPLPQRPAESRAPSQEDIEQGVVDAQKQLADLKRMQEQLERERASLEEARRRRAEYKNGRGEMLAHLTRGTQLLDEAEFAARRDAEQMARTLADLRDKLGQVERLQEESWTKESWNTELTRALTVLENARMEWNSARLKWPILDGAMRSNPAKPGAEGTGGADRLAGMDFWMLTRLGLAIGWPVLLATLMVGTVIIVMLARG